MGLEIVLACIASIRYFLNTLEIALDEYKIIKNAQN